jgi:flagellar biosynthetic protein FlhB
MADERTEAATPKRRAEARKRGQSARSHDLTGAVVLLAGIYGIKILAADVAGKLKALLIGNVIAVGAFNKDGPVTPGGDVFGVLLGVLPPLLGLMAAMAVVISVVQGGFVFAPGLLAPKAERLNPFSGAKRIFSLQGLMQSGKTLARFAAVAGAVAWVVSDNMAKLSALGALELLPGVNVVAGMIWDALLRAVIALLALGALDYAWERRRFLNSIRMTKQEVREEYRQSEGDPQVRAQRRRRREQHFREMLKNVQKADVLVTNPTHFAVALQYDQLTMAAPTVVAKGQDLIALRLREAAKEAGVPVMENPPLARALYKLVPVGGQIPADLYLAVAEILAFVFRLRTAS